MADASVISGKSAEASIDKGRKLTKLKNTQRKSKGGSKNTVAPLIPAEAGAGMSRPGQTIKPTTFIKPRNKPMFDDLDVAGFNGVTPCHGRSRIAITAEGFIPLIEKEYNILATKESHFAKMISQSMFLYYCVQHLYVRLVYLRKNDHDKLPLAEEQFLEYFDSGNYTVPDPIKAYINGIGVVTDASGIEYNIDFLAWPNRQGDFGRISEETHFMYASLPSARIAALRVQQDLAYTIVPNTAANWQLPEDLVPAEAAAGLPTKNLLGWAPSVALTSDQYASLEDLDITVDNFPSRYGGFKLNNNLMSRVSCTLETMKNIKTSKVLMTTSVGSQAIISYTDVEHSNYDFIRNTQYAELGNVRQIASQQLDVRASLVGLLMTYRCRKNTFNQRNYWCVYDFGEYANVPQGWVTTSNNIFVHGRAERLNEMEFITPFSRKDVYREPWLTRQ